MDESRVWAPKQKLLIGWRGLTKENLLKNIGVKVSVHTLSECLYRMQIYSNNQPVDPAVKHAMSSRRQLRIESLSKQK